MAETPKQRIRVRQQSYSDAELHNNRPATPCPLSNREELAERRYGSSEPPLKLSHFQTPPRLNRSASSSALFSASESQRKRRKRPPQSPSHNSHLTPTMRRSPASSTSSRAMFSRSPADFDTSPKVSIESPSLEPTHIETETPTRRMHVPRSPRMDAVDYNAAVRRRRGGGKARNPWSSEEDEGSVGSSQYARSLPLDTPENVKYRRSLDDSFDSQSSRVSFAELPLADSANPYLPSDIDSLNSSTASTSSLAARRTGKVGQLPRLQARSDRLSSSLHSATTPRDPRFEDRRRDISLEEDLDDSNDDQIDDVRPARREKKISLSEVLKETNVSPVLPPISAFSDNKSRSAGTDMATVKDTRRRSLTAVYPTTVSTAPIRARASGRTRSKTQAGVWLQDVLVWALLPDAHSFVAQKERSGVFSKAPLIRDVPAAVRKRVAKRDSTQMLSASASSPSFPTFYGDPKGKRKDPQRESFSYSPAGPNGHYYTWRKAECAIHRSGLLTVTTVEDQIPIHSIPVSLLETSDVDVADASLFGRSHCLALRAASSSALVDEHDYRSPGLQPPTTSRGRSSFSEHSNSTTYIAFPSLSAINSTLAVLKAHAAPASLPSYSLGTPGRDVIQQSSLRDSLDGAQSRNSDDIRLWRSVELTISDVFIDTSATPRADPRLQFAASRANSVEELPDVRTSGKDNASRTKSKSDALHQDIFFEVYMDGRIVGRTQPTVRNPNSYRTEFRWRDVPLMTSVISIKVFDVNLSKVPLEVCLQGVAAMPLQGVRRGQPIEHWYPLLERSRSSVQSQTKGEINIRLTLSDIPILPLSEYARLQETFLCDDQPNLAYQLLGQLHRQSETVSEVILRINHELGLLPKRLLEMAEREVDGDPTGANILFRGNSLLTKSMELYLRLVGTSFLDASIGEIVATLCAEGTELEINPEKLQISKDNDLDGNVKSLQRWTALVWNSLYQARHRCPFEIRAVFQHIQKLVSQRYVSSVAETTKFTSISAFMFLRFFVPALLNPRLFGLTQNQPKPGVQRTLTLIAKTLQGLANMATFGAKEPYMSVMNSFVEDNKQAFVDYIYSVSTVFDKEESRQIDESEGQKEAALIRAKKTPEIAKDAVPALPYLFDLGKEYASLCLFVAKEAKASKRRDEDEQDVVFRRLVDLCIDLHNQAEHRFAALIERDHHLATVFGPEEARPSIDERVEYINLDGNSSNTSLRHFSLKHVSKGRSRAQTVSAMLQRSPTSRLNALPQNSEAEHLKTPPRSIRRVTDVPSLPDSRESPRSSVNPDDVSISSSHDGSEKGSGRLRRLFMA